MINDELKRDLWTYDYLVDLDCGWKYNYLTHAILSDHSIKIYNTYHNKPIHHYGMNKSGIIDDIEFDVFGVYIHVSFLDGTQGLYTIDEMN